MGEWSNLTQREKAQIIKFAIKNGVSDINTIRDTFNVYAKDSLANVDYNMAAAKASGFGSNGNGHYPDTFKKPNHPTFSDESIYHSEVTPGGRWRGNTYEPSDFVLNQQGSWNNFLKGFYEQEQGTGAVPVFNGGVMLPEVTIAPKYKKGGSIHIKHPGRLAALKERTGKTEAELWATGNAHTRKMITFARNARKWHKGANGMYLDTDANTRTYNDALDYFTQLGFKGKNASDLALQYAADNMQYDAGTLPEVTITPNVQKHVIIDNGTKNVYYAPHTAPVQESTESKIAAGMIGIPLISTQAAPVLGEAVSKAMAARDAFRLAHPYLSALNDITWTNLGLHDLATDNGIAKTKRLINEGKKGRALLSGLGDAANALGAFELFRVGSKIANPAYRSAWAYNTIPNWGYKKHLERADNWISGLLSGTSPNINNEAEWLTTELRKDLIENGTDQFGYLSALFSKNKNAGIEIAARGRDDASRLYNGLPLRHNYYIQNADGSYSYNLAKIEDDWKKLSGEDYFPLRYDEFYPESLATSGHHGVDVITGGGGNLTGNDFIGRVTVGNFPNEEEFAVKLIEDIQDVHPFRRNQNTFSKTLQKIIDEKTRKVQKKVDYLYTSIYNVLNKGQDYGQSKIGKLWYDWLGGEVLNKIRYSGQFRLPGTYYDKSTNGIAVNDFWKTVNAKMRDFELGTLTGAKPFLMRTEVPTTLKYKLTTPNRVGDAKSLEDALNSIGLEPTLILGHHSDKYVIPGVVNPSSRFNIDYSNYINPKFGFNDYLKSTGGPLYLYPFSFQKNPHMRTPVVRYNTGGHLFKQGGPKLLLDYIEDFNNSVEDATESLPLISIAEENKRQSEENRKLSNAFDNAVANGGKGVPYNIKQAKDFTNLINLVQKHNDYLDEAQNVDANFGIPYLENKRIQLSNGRIIPSNTLDTLFKYSEVANVDPAILLGLAMKETAFGNTGPYRKANSKSEMTKLFNGEGDYFRQRGYISPSELLNYHNIWNSPYIGEWNALLRNAGSNPASWGVEDQLGEYSNLLTNEFSHLGTGDSPIEIGKVFNPKNNNLVGQRLKILDRQAQDKLSINPWVGAINLFLSGKYNPGDSTHTESVYKLGRELLLDPVVKQVQNQKAWRE